LVEPAGLLQVGSAFGQQNNQLVISAGGTVEATNVSIQVGNAADIAGSLNTANSSTTGRLVVAGALTLTGLLEANAVIVSSGASLDFLSGKLTASAMTDAASEPFVIGDGTDSATYVMQGGTHSFQKGLVISSNSVLLGCGTVSGSVTNYGLIVLTNGCDMTFTGSVVNYGTIEALNGDAHFQSTIANNGTLFQKSATVTALSFSGPDVVIQFDTISNYIFEVQAINNLAAGTWLPLTNGLAGTGRPITITDVDAGTNGQRFYRVLLKY
jgi:hypothetical protein